MVLVTYGRAAALPALLRDLKAQTRPPHTIFVVDDTPDASVQTVVQAAGASYHRNPKHAGTATARNHGMELSKADLLTFLDSDVHVAPDYLQRIQEALQRDPQAIAATGHVTNLKAMGRFKRGVAAVFGLNRRSPSDCRLLANLNTTYPMALDDPRPVPWMWGCNITLRRAAMDRVRFDEQFVRYSLGEDIELSLQLRAAFPDHHLLMVPDARLQDDRSTEGRLGFDDVVRMRTINRAYTMRKHGLRLPFKAVRLLWSDLGGLGVKLASEPWHVLPGLRGLARGWWAIARHRDDLRRGDLTRLNEGYRFRRRSP